MFVDQIFEECAEILGTTDEKRVYRKITQAVQTLMESGHWLQSTADVDVCTGWDGCTVALPRGIDVPLAVNVDGSPVYFRNRLFQYHVNKGGQFNTVDWAWDDRGYVATLMQIVQPSQLVAIAESENDVGKIIRVTGTDSNNRDLRSQLKDGTGVDGLLIPIHSQSDFAYGTIAPDDATIRTREVTITPISKFTSTTPHTLDSGQGMAITAISGTIPVPLSNGQVYYIGVLDALTIQIYNDSLNAQAGNYPISLQSIVGAGPLKFLDSRTSFVVTALQFASAPTIEITTANPITFPSNQALPIGIRSGVTYFGNLLDSTHLQVFSSISDAQANVNEIHTTGSTNPINVDIRKEIVPETKLTFSVDHLLTQGDQVQIFTSGGTLPQPLIANQNYFVNIVDTKSVSIHTTQADALLSSQIDFVNPIKLTTAGSGTVSIIKLIQAASRTGTESQITASGLALSTPSGSGAQFQAIVVGSVTSIRVTAGGNYTVAPNVIFSDPQDPPAGSNIETRTATGYALLAGTAVTSIVITDGGFGYATAPSISFDSGVAKATATVTTSFVSGFVKISGGFNYQESPQIQITGGNGSGATATATVNIDNLSVLSLIRSGTTATATTTAAHGFSTNQTVKISGASPDEYNGEVQVTVPRINTSVYSLQRAGITATAYTSTAHNYNTGDRVTISGATGTSAGYNSNYNVIVTGPTTFTIKVPSSLPDPAVGTIVSSIEDNTATTFTYTVSNTLTTPAGGTITVFSGEVIAINLVTSGTIYTSIPSVIITPSTGVFVQFSATGTLPSPLVSGTAYRAESPLNGSTGTFTVKNSDFSDVNIISSATGTFYVVLSRAFSVSFTNKWLGDFTNLINQEIPVVSIIKTTLTTAEVTTPIAHGLSTNDVVYINGVTNQSNYNGAKQITILNPTQFTYDIEAITTTPAVGVNITALLLTKIYFGTDYLLPTTNPAIDNGSTPAYLNIFSTSVATAYTTAGVATTGLISVVSFGTGQSYYAKRFSVSPLPYNNLIQPSNVQFLQENETVKFSTSGVLPSPLVAGTDYQVRVVGDSVNVYSSGVLVPITTPGTGQLALDIQRTLNVSPSTSIVADASLYTTGQSVTVRANSGDLLPDGLVAGTTYFIRRIDNNEFELYDTKAQSQNLSSVVGRREFLTSGLSTDSKFFVDAIEDPTLVKSVANIQKPITDGFVSLYAMDYGRSNDLTLIGQYHPQEVNPQYRRIRIGKPCAWVRIAYRIKPPVITSKYDFIPIEHTRAIITAVHACDLEDKDFAEQALRYWGFSLAYLKNQQEHQDGHAFVPPQINNETYGDGSDPVMF